MPVNGSMPCKKNDYGLFIGIILLFSMLTFFGMSWYNNDWSTYGVNVLARLGYYPNDFVAQSAVQYGTPQIALDYIIIGLLKTGISYPASTLLIYIVSCLLLVFGVLLICREIDSSNYLLGGLFVVVYLNFNTFGYGLGANVLWLSSLYHYTAALPYCLFALYYAIKRKNSFIVSYIFCSIAAVLQIQVGFYFGVLVFVYQCIFSIVEKKKFHWQAVLFLIGPLGILYGLFGSSPSIFSNHDFVEIYARYRHSHHMIPSAWGFENYIIFALFISSILLVFYKKLYREGENKTIFLWLVAISVLTWLSLFVNYIFTDSLPWAIIVKIQPARIVSLMLVCFVIAFLYLFAQYRKNEEYAPILVAFLLFLVTYKLAPLHIAIFMAIASSVYFFFDFSKIIVSKKKVHLFSILAAIVFFIVYLISRQRFYMYAACLLFLLAVFIADWKKSAVYFFAGIPLCLYIFFAATAPHFFSSSVNDDLVVLGKRFEHSTAADVIFFSDPQDSSLADFAFFSRRSPVVTFKNIPIHDPAIKEWIDRLFDFGLVQEKDGRYSNHIPAYSKIEELKKMQKYGASYILTYKDKALEYLSTGLVKEYDTEGSYVILTLKQIPLE